MSPRRVVSPLVAAVKRDIAAAGRRVPGVERSAAAVLAVKLAGDVEGEEFLSSRVAAARVLSDLLDGFQALASVGESVDRLDELTARRARRKAS